MNPEEIYNTSVTFKIDKYNYFKKESLAYMSWGRGEHCYSYKNSKNEFRFKQNKFIVDHLERVNYVQKLLNMSSNIKALDRYFNKIVRVGINNGPKLFFSIKDFPNKDVLQKIKNNNYLIIYNLMKKSIKYSLTSPSALLNIVMQSMPEVFDDFDFNFEVEKVYTRDDVKNNPKLEMLLGDINDINGAFFKASAILFKFKIWLLKDNIRSDNYIEDYLMSDVDYTN